PGEFATLSRVNGAYQLRELDGTLTAFRTDGKIDFQQEPNGNRVTYVYTNGRVTSLVATIGDQIDFTYNGQGRISQMRDPVGRITTFTYDASGEHLLTVTAPEGTTRFAYVTGQGAAREHALQSITFPDNSHLFFEYDTQGRLTRQSRDGGAEAVVYTYGPGGMIIVTNAAGQAHTVLRNDAERVAQVLDPQGRSARFGFDADHSL